ncbi:helicase, partial [Tanacetum coccineum]
SSSFQCNYWSGWESAELLWPEAGRYTSRQIRSKTKRNNLDFEVRTYPCQRRSTGPAHVRAAKKTPKGAALTSAGVPAAYHNLGPPSYQCSSCYATMWYEERNDKARRALNPTFSLCCQEGKVLLSQFNEAPTQLTKLLDYNDPTTSSYMALQYPLLFLYGEDGFHEKIAYHNNAGSRKTKRGYVTMKEYYAYIIQQRHNQGTTLLRGGRLFQQYLVDAFTAIEEQRLKWTRNNQDTLRVDLYHNLWDAVTRGDTSAAGLGKRIVLPRTFTGSPRYMMQNYQDVMALCRTYENPDLFITFTSNPKWSKIAEMLAYVLGKKSHDRPEVGTRVLK